MCIRDRLTRERTLSLHALVVLNSSSGQHVDVGREVHRFLPIDGKLHGSGFDLGKLCMVVNSVLEEGHLHVVRDLVRVIVNKFMILTTLLLEMQDIDDTALGNAGGSPWSDLSNRAT